MRDLSRRAFLNGALIAGAGMLGAEALSGCAPKSAKEAASSTSSSAAGASDGAYPWPAQAPEISDSDVEQEVNGDIIVIGLGLAGVAATRSAAEKGASVITFEKSSQPNTRSGQYAILGGKTMARWGRENVVDVKTAADYEMDECSYYPKRSILQKWARHSGEVFDWFIQGKPDLYICENSYQDIPDGVDCYLQPFHLPLPPTYDAATEEHPCYPASVQICPSHTPVVLANFEKARTEGDVKPFFGHFVEKLIKEGDRVVGCYARNADTGKYVKATANKGVILTTGEYGSNKTFLDYFCPAVSQNGVKEYWPNMDVEGKPCNQGDGLKLGNWVGAAVQQHHAPMIHWMAKINGKGGNDMSPVGCAPFLTLNRDGKRFMNEDVPSTQMENQIELQPERLAYQIWDANWGQQWASFPIKHGMPTYYRDAYPKNDAANPKEVITPQACDTAVAAGLAYKSDTIEGLLKQLEGIDTAQALKSVARYNDLAHNGNDEDFGKIAKRLFPVENAPFYGTVCRVDDLLVCIGGLESDEDCHVYTEDRTVLKGLYVAGNIQGNRYAVVYPIAFKGASHSMALYYGYTAGKNAVAGV